MTCASSVAVRGPVPGDNPGRPACRYHDERRRPRWTAAPIPRRPHPHRPPRRPICADHPVRVPARWPGRRSCCRPGGSAHTLPYPGHTERDAPVVPGVSCPAVPTRSAASRAQGSFCSPSPASRPSTRSGPGRGRCREHCRWSHPAGRWQAIWRADHLVLHQHSQRHRGFVIRPKRRQRQISARRMGAGPRLADG